MARIQAMDQLPLGVKVRVGNKVGHVVKVELVESSNRAGLIALHTIEFTHKVVYSFGTKFRLEELAKPKRQSVNYASIWVVED